MKGSFGLLEIEGWSYVKGVQIFVIGRHASRGYENRALLGVRVTWSRGRFGKRHSYLLLRVLFINMDFRIT